MKVKKTVVSCNSNLIMICLYLQIKSSTAGIRLPVASHHIRPTVEIMN